MRILPTLTPFVISLLLALSPPASTPTTQPADVNPKSSSLAGPDTPALPPLSDAPVENPAEVDRLLGVLHQRGLDLVDFDADVVLTDTDATTGDATSRAGRVLYHKPVDGPSRLRVSFETKDEGSGPRPDRIEYLLDGPTLTDRNHRRKTEVRRQVLRPGERINLLKLGEGPFPLPIGQDPVEVKRQFNVTLLEPDEGTPRLRLSPKEGTRLARKFSQIDVWVDPATRFPLRIESTDANQTSTRGTLLSNIRVNPAGGLKDSDFALSPLPGDWKLTEEPYAE